MKPLDVRSILGNKERPWFDVCWLDVDRQAAALWFGCPPEVAWVDGLGDADYWAVEFDCGLRVAFEFLHHGPSACVFASEPVPEHVRRHLSHWRDHFHEYPAEAFARERKHFIESFAAQRPELTRLHDFQLWRQGDDGNPVKVGFATSELDAKCWQAELESHNHKQIYWVSSIYAEDAGSHNNSPCDSSAISAQSAVKNNARPRSQD
jgi:hypothetical protein